MKFATPLPIDAILDELTTALATRTSAVLVAPPGAGKTTRVPLALMDESWLRGRKILVLEPRRIAARAAAERMAHTLSEAVGERIGLRARMVSKSGSKTRVEIVTEGVFTRMILDDPALSGIGAVLYSTSSTSARSMPIWDLPSRSTVSVACGMTCASCLCQRR
jgi:ATP-dependent helicase HrpB